MSKTDEIIAVDPVCGMSVDAARAAAIREHGGKRYFFCCPACAQNFVANAESYLAKSKSAGLVQLGQTPPQSPKEMVAQPAAKGLKQPFLTKYFCPMDPEVVSSKPGSCPKCGMAL